jgi:hypothetical protein
MAEIPGAPHSDECSNADGTTCVCACRGTLHGRGLAGRTAVVVRRMAQVAAANADTPAERRNHPVTVESGTAAADVDPAPVRVVSPMRPDLSQVPDSELFAGVIANMGSDLGTQYGTEIHRRSELKKELAARAALESAAFNKRPEDLGEDELYEVFSFATELGDESLMQRLVDEMDRREDHDRRKAAGPQGPALVSNPVGQWGLIQSYATTDSSSPDRRRMTTAQQRTLGLPDDAGEKDIRAAEAADSMSVEERTSWYLAWYRHEAEFGNLPVDAREWQRGPADEGGLTVPRKAVRAANVAKPWDTWKEISEQAQKDRAAGDPSTHDRYAMAMRHAYGLADTAPLADIQVAHRWDTRTENQQAALFITAFRDLAEFAGVDRNDRLRYGPPDRGTSQTARSRPTQWREPTPEQDRRLDELLGRGMDYVEAYAAVHDIDPTSMRAEQATSAVDRSGAETTDRAVRRQYDEWVSLRYAQAEADTRGHLLNSAGKSIRMDPVMLFSGPLATARKYASEDLLRWWSDNGRMTYTQFKAQVLGRRADTAAAKVTAGQSNGRDFV